MKRFTIDVPVCLHRQIKAVCALRGLNTSSVLRDLLECEFPDTLAAIAIAVTDQVPVPDNPSDN
jgi:hypothetical protein